MDERGRSRRSLGNSELRVELEFVVWCCDSRGVLFE